MSDIAVRLEAGSTIISTMSIAELRAEFAATLTMTARHLVHLADVWQELQRRGEDLSDLRSGLWSYMQLIARGELRAELVVRYAGNSLLLRRMAALSVQDQDHLLRAGRIDLATWDGDEIVVRSVELPQLKAPEMARVMRGRIIPAAEQKRYLAASSLSPPPRKPSSPSSSALVASQSRKSFSRKNTGLTLVVKLSEEERTALKSWSKKNKMSVGDLVGGALHAAGFLLMPIKDEGE